MKTFTQLINEIGIPKMGKAFNQRALKTINPKNIKQLPQNVQKLGRTTELIGKNVKSQGRVDHLNRYWKDKHSNKPIKSPIVDKGDARIVGGELVRSAGRGMQAVAKKM